MLAESYADRKQIRWSSKLRQVMLKSQHGKESAVSNGKLTPPTPEYVDLSMGVMQKLERFLQLELPQELGRVHQLSIAVKVMDGKSTLNEGRYIDNGFAGTLWRARVHLRNVK
ncbi:hypothetical protein Tco_0534070 [Tanacetum coccineum]